MGFSSVQNHARLNLCYHVSRQCFKEGPTLLYGGGGSLFTSHVNVIYNYVEIFLIELCCFVAKENKHLMNFFDENPDFILIHQEHQVTGLHDNFPNKIVMLC